MGAATKTMTRAPGSAEAMVERIIAGGSKSGAEALKDLRAAFPDSPLSLREFGANGTDASLIARRSVAAAGSFDRINPSERVNDALGRNIQGLISTS